MDVIHKWLLINYSFVLVQISLPSLIDQDSLLTVQCPMFTNDENWKKLKYSKLRFNGHANYAKNKSEYKHINRKKDTIGTLINKLETWPCVL